MVWWSLKSEHELTFYMVFQFFFVKSFVRIQKIITFVAETFIKGQITSQNPIDYIM